MSCGNPHETDCREVIEKVYYYLDNEALDDENRAKIRVHLDECAPCLREFGIEQEVRALVARCCGAEHAPGELRQKVLVRIQQVRVEMGTIELRTD